MRTGAHLCCPPLLFSSPKLLPAPTEPLLSAEGTQDTKHIDYFLALIYGTHIKTDCFWWCSRYCSTEIPKGCHKTLPHYCKCWQTLMNRLRYLPLLRQKLKPHCWHFPGLLTLSARSDFMVPNCATAKKWRYCKLTQHVLRRGPWTPGFPWLLPQSLLGQTHLSYRDWTPSES